MENKEKVVFSLLFLCFLGCFNSPKTAVILSKNTDGNWVLKMRDSSIVDSVMYDGKPYALHKVIDVETFNYLHEFKEDSIKIGNPYYSVNPYNKYFRDKKHLYFLVNDSSTYLKQVCKVNDYEVLGGLYIKVGDVIYWKGRKLANPDLESFRIEHITRNKSEWEKTIGIDKNNIYNGDRIMSQAHFESLFWKNKDSLRGFYY